MKDSKETKQAIEDFLQSGGKIKEITKKDVLKAGVRVSGKIWKKVKNPSWSGRSKKGDDKQ